MDQNNQEKPKKLLEMREEEKKPLLSDKAKKEIREWIVSMVAAVAVVLLLKTFLFTVIRVDGPSMRETLQNNDRLMVSVLDMRLNGPERFDVVIMKYPNRKENFVKRVIGLPGDTLIVQEGVLYINGERYEEPYLDEGRTVRFDKSSNNFSVTLGDDEYFVMGDNRDDSNDSRNVGVISRDMFIGKVRHIIWPISRFGSVPGSEVYGE